MSFERLAPGQYMGTPLLGDFPLSPEPKRTVPKLFVQTICFTLKTCFPSGSLEFGHVPSTDCPCDQNPIKNLGTESLTNFPVGGISHTLSRHITGGIQHILCGPTGRGPLDACTWFPWTSPHAPFPLADYALYPFAVINHGMSTTTC